jgi:hypothetical protein
MTLRQRSVPRARQHLVQQAGEGAELLFVIGSALPNHVMCFLTAADVPDLAGGSDGA